MTQQLEARAFAIWRYAAPRAWDVSYDEIGDATGLTYRQISAVITKKGWGGRIGEGRQTESGTHANKIKAHLREKRFGHRFDENALDVVQLIGE